MLTLEMSTKGTTVLTISPPPKKNVIGSLAISLPLCLPLFPAHWAIPSFLSLMMAWDETVTIWLDGEGWWTCAWWCGQFGHSHWRFKTDHQDNSQAADGEIVYPALDTLDKGLGQTWVDTLLYFSQWHMTKSVYLFWSFQFNIFLKIYLFSLCGGMFCLHTCLCIMYILAIYAGQKKMSNPLELDLQIILSYHVLGIETRFSASAASAFNPWAISPSLIQYFWNIADCR